MLTQLHCYNSLRTDQRSGDPNADGLGLYPGRHELMAGMVGLQTAHRYGNATYWRPTWCLVSVTVLRTVIPVGREIHRRAQNRSYRY